MISTFNLILVLYQTYMRLQIVHAVKDVLPLKVMACALAMASQAAKWNAAKWNQRTSAMFMCMRVGDGMYGFWGCIYGRLWEPKRTAQEIQLNIQSRKL